MTGKNSRKIIEQLLLMLCMLKEKKYIQPFLKHDSNCEKQVILLMIPNGKEWHYLAVKKLSTLLRGITSKHHGHFYCLICLHSFATEKNVNHIKKYVKIKIFVML